MKPRTATHARRKSHSLADPFSDLGAHRALAQELYRRCLQEAAVSPLMSFIEILLTVEQPPMQLLHAIKDDLDERLNALRKAAYDCYLLREESESSAQLQHDLQLTNTLHSMLSEWLKALLIMQSRQAQADQAITAAIRHSDGAPSRTVI